MAAKSADGGPHPVDRNAEPSEDTCPSARVDAQQAEQDVLGADVLDAHQLGFFLSRHQSPLRVLGEPFERVFIDVVQLNAQVPNRDLPS